MNNPTINALHILMLHNHYQYAGGEDVCVKTEVELLRKAGHEVSVIAEHNDKIRNFSVLDQLQLLVTTAWNPKVYRKICSLLRQSRPNLLHVHNFFPLFSPSVHAAAKFLGIPTIQTLHNFRLGCLNGYLLRDNKICEICLGHNPWKGVMYHCYRESLPASLGVWSMVTFNRWRGTWLRDVDAFITPSKFAAQKFLEIGIPENRLYVKPNMIPDPLVGQTMSAAPTKPTFVFVGRLSPEKGAMTLLQAWKQLAEPEWQLDIVGCGIQQQDLEKFVKEQELSNVNFSGYLALFQVLEVIKSATAVVVPSQWYETFGRVIIEAFGCGKVVLAANLGALSELVQEDKTGFLIPHADVNAWVERLRWCGNHPEQIDRIGKNARQTYQQLYTPEINYRQILEIYKRVLA